MLFKLGGRRLRNQNSYLQIENYHLGPATSRNFEPVKTKKFCWGLLKGGHLFTRNGFFNDSRKTCSSRSVLLAGEEVACVTCRIGAITPPYY